MWILFSSIVYLCVCVCVTRGGGGLHEYEGAINRLVVVGFVVVVCT